MSKAPNERRVANNEARAYAHMIRSSAQKLNVVAGLIRGKRVDVAVRELTFSKRRVAQEVKKVLQSAIDNAENNHDLDVDNLVVAQASVGKSVKMKRFHARGRGRAAMVEKPWSNLTIVVREVEEA